MTVSVEGEDAVLEVVDNGPGIPDELRPRIFERFVRGNGDARRGGSGLGLAIVQAVAQSHFGTVELAGNDDRPGTRFVVRLPLVPAANPVAAAGRAAGGAVLVRSPRSADRRGPQICRSAARAVTAYCVCRSAICGPLRLRTADCGLCRYTLQPLDRHGHPQVVALHVVDAEARAAARPSAGRRRTRRPSSARAPARSRSSRRRPAGRRVLVVSPRMKSPSIFT